MESPEVTRFRKLILDGQWSEAGSEVSNLVPDDCELQRVSHLSCLLFRTIDDNTYIGGAVSSQ